MPSSTSPKSNSLKRKPRWRRWLRKALWCLLLLVVALVILDRWPHAPLKDAATYSRTVSDCNGELLRMTLADDAHYRLWLPMEEMSESLVQSVLLKEDRYFYRHPGINPVALVRAALATYVGGNRQGASTVTMQLARRLYGIQSRHIGGKLKQMVMALWLEACYSKHDILEAYLNFVPMGGNIEGVEAASRIYFHKPAQELSLSESLALAVIPQNPTPRARFAGSLQEARSLLMRQWLEAYPDDRRSASLIDLPITAWKREDLPFHAPHYTDMLLAREDNAHIQGTLDLDLQRVLEDIIAGFVQERLPQGVRNATALLVDTRDLGVKAMVGSADYLNREIHGQVNGTTARRSPGSTVKPFLYALAIDQGVIHPLTMLRDAPSTYGGAFLPENFDGRFVGPIPAKDALIRSRNVPAVWLANQTRKPTLYQFIKQAGVGLPKPEEHYGLSFALGGGEMRMTELATLYTLLAKDGSVRPLRYTEDEPLTEGPSLLSLQAVFITRDMLFQNPRLDGLPPDPRNRAWRVAWKTGTSWGYHDAWTAGIVGPYVLVVWVGNFDGAANPVFIGIKTAAPLFFKIADALPLVRPDVKQVPDRAPSGVSRIDVCAASGDLPNAWCPRTVKTWFIPGVSPIRVSTLHQPVMIDSRTGQAALPPYDPQYVREEVFEFWPSDMQQLFAQAGMPRRRPPVLAGSVRPAAAGENPRIESPVSQVTYTLKLNAQNSTIMLQAHAAADAQRLYWFNGARLLGQTVPGETLEWRPERPGWQALSVSDERGRSSSRRIQVEFIP